jgi:cytochrome d ubiquinol oxidase subunit II
MEMLALAWVGIIAFCIMMYIILDGFTLGTGMLVPFMVPAERDIAMSVILPTWDGNQTWLVLGMASLYGAFPLAFSTLLPILYLPLLMMVLALLLRGAVFEFRLKSKRGRANWDWLFGAASLWVAVTQGLILGNFIQGFAAAPSVTQVPEHHWLNPFSIVTAVSIVFGYLLLAATRLILKTSGALQGKMYPIAYLCLALVAISMVVVSLWTPFIHPYVTARWFNLNYWLYLAMLPIITGIIFLLLVFALYKKAEYGPYWLSVMLFFCPYIGFIISLYPYLVPYTITINEAASPPGTLLFILIGALIMIPVLLVYTGYSYHIFRGKVDKVLHY